MGAAPSLWRNKWRSSKCEIWTAFKLFSESDSLLFVCVSNFTACFVRSALHFDGLRIYLSKKLLGTVKSSAGVLTHALLYGGVCPFSGCTCFVKSVCKEMSKMDPQCQNCLSLFLLEGATRAEYISGAQQLHFPLSFFSPSPPLTSRAPALHSFLRWVWSTPVCSLVFRWDSLLVLGFL